MFIRIRTNTAEKTSFILKICPDDDAVRHHGLGEWLPLKRQAASRPRDKSLLHNVNELAPLCCGAIHMGSPIALDRCGQRPGGEVVEPDGIEPTTSSLQS